MVYFGSDSNQVLSPAAAAKVHIGMYYPHVSREGVITRETLVLGA